MTKTRLNSLVRRLGALMDRRLSALLILWVVGSFSMAFAAAPNKAGATSAVIKPAVLYHNYCSVCHGDKGDGKSRAQNSLNPPPRDFTTPGAAQIPRSNMVAVVQNGRPGTAMTGWKSQLNQAEIEAVVDYVRDNFMMASSLADSSRGRSVYSKNCAVCHGEKGDGKSRAQGSLIPPPRDFTSAASRVELSAQRMITSVTYGRTDTAMAGFKTQLSKEDISAVVDYIQAGFMGGVNTEGISGVNQGRRQAAQDGSNAPPALASAIPAAKPVQEAIVANMTLPMPSGLKGDAKLGEAFYLANCATCHGATGDGRGPRAYFINPKPRNFLHPASRQSLNRVMLYATISHGKLGTEMPAWNKVLSPQEIANVAEFVFQKYIQPGNDSAKTAKASK